MKSLAAPFATPELSQRKLSGALPPCPQAVRRVLYWALCAWNAAVRQAQGARELAMHWAQHSQSCLMTQVCGGMHMRVLVFRMGQHMFGCVGTSG